MPRPRKIQAGDAENRTVVLRKKQVQQLEDAAAGLGVDVSEVVRAVLDWHLPLADADRRVRLLAALHLVWGRLAGTPALARAVLDGWAGREMTVPLDARLDAGQVRLVKRAVAIARRLGPDGPDGPDGPGGVRPPDRPALPESWASEAPDDLLAVLACPAARVVCVGSGGRPDVFLVPQVPTPTPSERRGRVKARANLPEKGYDRPAAALAGLVIDGVVRDVAAALPDWLRDVRWGAYQIDWAHQRARR